MVGTTSSYSRGSAWPSRLLAIWTLDAPNPVGDIFFSRGASHASGLGASLPPAAAKARKRTSTSRYGMG
jgi:hypothetical protein